MTASLVCSVAIHAALRADTCAWLDLPICALQHVDSGDGEPAEVLIHKQCPALGCGGAVGKLVLLVGELAAVYRTLVAEQAKSVAGCSIQLIYTCKRALDGDAQALASWRAASELERLMDLGTRCAVITVDTLIAAGITPLSPDARYTAAFDAVLAIGADLVLYDRDHVGAAAALATWAALHGLAVERREFAPGDCWAACLSVATGPRGTPRHRSIDVYLRA